MNSPECHRILWKIARNFRELLSDLVGKRDLIFLGYGVILLMGTSCFYDEGLPESGPPGGVVSYSLDIQPIFNTNCVSCHPGVVASPDLTEGNSYGSIMNNIYIIPNNPDESLLYQRIIGTPSIMPPNGSLPAAEINLIRGWIEQGALNN